MQKRSIKIQGHATSLALEEEFWLALKQIAQEQGVSLPTLIARIDQNSTEISYRNLARHLRVYALGYYRDKIYGNREGDLLR